MRDQEKTASINESGTMMMGGLYNDKGSEKLTDEQIFSPENHGSYATDEANDVFDSMFDEVASGSMLMPVQTQPQDEGEARDSKGTPYPSGEDTKTTGVLTPPEDSGEESQAVNNPQFNPQFDFSLPDDLVPPISDIPTDEVRELPMWGLPPELQKVIDEVTKGYQCSRDYVVASMMVAASTMLGKRVSSVFNNHTNFPSLWVAIVGRTASGKTAPLSFFFKPIELMEREAIAEYRRDLQRWNDGGNKGSKPEFRHALINNPSDESVLRELSVNGSICWKTDELRTMFDSWGRYSKNGGTIVGNLLSIFNNVDVNITRITSEPIYIPEPNLNIIGGIQPPILKRVMGNRGFTDDGLFQRFLIVFPEDTEIPPFADVVISDDVRGVWSATIDRLAHIPDLTIIHESETAKQMHVDAINRWRSECNEHYRDIEAMTSLLQKLEIHLCRWSIVTAVLSGQQEITADIMRYSIECMEYFKRCGEKAFCLIANDDQPKVLSNADVLRLLYKHFPDLNKSKLADAIHRHQQYVSRELNK